MTGGLKTGDFDFDLPEGAIADRPAVPREAARLLEVGPSLHDRSVADLPELLRAGDVLVVNDTKVIPARIVGTRGRARVEATLLRPLDCTAEGETWSALARPARRLRPGDIIEVSETFRAQVVDRVEGRRNPTALSPGYRRACRAGGARRDSPPPLYQAAGGRG